MIRRVTFKKSFKWRLDHKSFLFHRGETIIFDSKFNLIVGELNSGKSTLLELIRSGIEAFNYPIPPRGQTRRADAEIHKSKDHLDIEIELPLGKDRQKLRAINFHRELAKLSNLDKTAINGYSSWYLNSPHVHRKIKHNTEIIRELLEPDGQKTPNGALIILDEPDISITTSTALWIVTYLLELVERKNCQVIMSATNPYIIRCFKRVYDVESKKWMTANEYELEKLLPKDTRQFFNKVQAIGKL